MSADKTTNTFVIFRSVILRSEMHPLHVPPPSVHGIQVALRPGYPPDYPPPLPRGTIIWAASDGSSAIDSSSGYYTVRPYVEVLAESRLSAVRTVRLYAHGQTSESFAENVPTGHKRGRSTAALACRKETELSDLRDPVKRKVSTASPPRGAYKQRTLTCPRAFSNQMKIWGRGPLPGMAVITAYHQVPRLESLEPDITQYIFTEEDVRMFVPEDDMQGIIEENPPGTTTATWTPPPEHIIHDTEMKSPRPKINTTLRAFSVMVERPRSIPPLRRFMSRSAASGRGMRESVTVGSCKPDAQGRSLQAPEKSLEIVKPSPEPLLRPVNPCPRQARQPPSWRGSWTPNKTTGPARLRGAGDAKHNAGRKERTRHIRPYKVPKSNHLDKAKTRAKKLPPRSTFQKAYGNTLSFAIAPAEDLATKLRERAEAFFGHLGNVLGMPRLPTFDANAFFNRGKQGNMRKTLQTEETQPRQKVRSESSLEELFRTLVVAEALPDTSEQQSPKNSVISPTESTVCSSPGTPTRRSKTEGPGPLAIGLSSDEEEDGCARGTSRSGSLLDILGGVTRNLGLFRLQ